MTNKIKNIKFDVYLPAIQSALPGTYCIHFPIVRDKLHQVFIANTNNGEYICKFNYKDIVMKNMKISSLLSENNIKGPESTAHVYKSYWFEVYKMIPGKPLCEFIDAGLPKEQIQKIYKSVVKEFIKISKIDYNTFSHYACKNIHDVVKLKFSNKYNSVIGYILGRLVFLLNASKKQKVSLYHCGISPKNILLDNNGKFVSLINLEDIAIASKNYAFSVMASEYKKLGLDVSDLFKIYEQKSGKKLNKNYIKIIAKSLIFLSKDKSY